MKKNQLVTKGLVDLRSKTVKELIGIAKELQIVGRHEMKKDQLVNAIEAAQEMKRRAQSADDESKAVLNKSLEAEIAKSNSVKTRWEHEDKPQKPKFKPRGKDSKGKASYIDNLKIGTIVAFKVNDQKVISGKVEEIHKGSFLIATKNGPKFTVLKSNIIWVKTGDRWPKGVYLALKGKGDADGRHTADSAGDQSFSEADRAVAVEAR